MEPERQLGMSVVEQLKSLRQRARYGIYQFHALPGVWKVHVACFGTNDLPRVKSITGGGMLPFEEAAEEATRVFLGDLAPDEMAAKKADIVRAWFKNRTKPEEYYILGFDRLTDRQRAAFLSREDKDIILSYRGGSGRKYLLLHDKYRFYQKFKPLYHRDVCMLQRSDDHRSFVNFCAKHSSFIAKNTQGHMGIGTVIRTHDGSEEGIRGEIEFLLSAGDAWIVEELIRQDKRMASLNPSSINTVRVCSRWNSKGFQVFETFIRMGRAGNVVDNIGSGGLSAEVDCTSGRVISDAVDNRRHAFAAHPDSGVVLKGFQIPRWDELMELTRQAHEMIPDYHYVGWDFALSKDGWVIVEGNWGYFISQYLGKGAREAFMECFR